MAVGFRGEREDDFRSIYRGIDQRTAFCWPIQLDVVQLAEEIDLSLCIPRDAFPAIAEFVH
ncbi:hypothetical protein D3C87_2083910 [compost metagenome]